MTREELWQVFVDKNPALGREGHQVIKLRIRGIKKMFDTAWDESEEQAFADISRDCRSDIDLPQFMKDLFKQ